MSQRTSIDFPTLLQSMGSEYIRVRTTPSGPTGAVYKTKYNPLWVFRDPGETFTYSCITGLETFKEGLGSASSMYFEGSGTQSLPQILLRPLNKAGIMTQDDRDQIVIGLHNDQMTGGVGVAHKIMDSKLQRIASELKTKGWTCGRTFATIKPNGIWTAQIPLELDKHQRTDLTGNVSVAGERPAIEVPDSCQEKWDPSERVLRVWLKNGTIYHASDPDAGASFQQTPVLAFWEQGSSGVFACCPETRMTINGSHPGLSPSDMLMAIVFENMPVGDPKFFLEKSKFSVNVMEGDVAAALEQLESWTAEAWSDVHQEWENKGWKPQTPIVPQERVHPISVGSTLTI